MARIRTIKPEFFTSEDIVGLSPLARLLYIALWCEADKAGRLVWKPRTFKLRYLPGDNCDVEALCAEIVAAGLVVLYGDGLAFIPRFSRHQHINPRESESVLPSPECDDEELTRADASPRVPHAQGGREGKGREGSSVPKGTDAAVASAALGHEGKHPEEQAKADLWRSAVVVLQAGGCVDEASCRTFMGKLVKDYTFPVVQQAVASAVSAQPPEAREYLKATCQRLKGERRDPVTVSSDGAAATVAELAKLAAHAAKAQSPEAREARLAALARLKPVQEAA